MKISEKKKKKKTSASEHAYVGVKSGHSHGKLNEVERDDHEGEGDYGSYQYDG